MCLISKSRFLTRRSVDLNPDSALESPGKLLKPTAAQILPQLIRISYTWDPDMGVHFQALLGDCNMQPGLQTTALCSVSLQWLFPCPTMYSLLCSFIMTIWRSNIHVEIFTKHCHSRICSQVQPERSLLISIYRL